jgi:hypothetical protein
LARNMARPPLVGGVEISATNRARRMVTKLTCGAEEFGPNLGPRPTEPGRYEAGLIGLRSGNNQLETLHNRY